MTHTNKKISYIDNTSYNMAIRLNHKNITDVPAIVKIDISISDPSVALNKRNILPILAALRVLLYFKYLSKDLMSYLRASRRHFTILSLCLSGSVKTFI